jgi:predicted nucleic acid-binding protein
VDQRTSRHVVPGDPADNSILQAALAAGADLLVTNDKRLLALHPYEGLRIISMADYFDLLKHEGLL